MSGLQGNNEPEDCPLASDPPIDRRRLLKRSNSSLNLRRQLIDNLSFVPTISENVDIKCYIQLARTLFYGAISLFQKKEFKRAYVDFNRFQTLVNETLPAHCQYGEGWTKEVREWLEEAKTSALLFIEESSLQLDIEEDKRLAENLEARLLMDETQLNQQLSGSSENLEHHRQESTSSSLISAEDYVDDWDDADLPNSFKVHYEQKHQLQQKVSVVNASPTYNPPRPARIRLESTSRNKSEHSSRSSSAASTPLHAHSHQSSSRASTPRNGTISPTAAGATAPVGGIGKVPTVVSSCTDPGATSNYESPTPPPAPKLPPTPPPSAQSTTHHTIMGKLGNLQGLAATTLSGIAAVARGSPLYRHRHAGREGADATAAADAAAISCADDAESTDNAPVDIAFPHYEDWQNFDADLAAAIAASEAEAFRSNTDSIDSSLLSQPSSSSASPLPSASSSATPTATARAHDSVHKRHQRKSSPRLPAGFTRETISILRYIPDYRRYSICPPDTTVIHLQLSQDKKYFFFRDDFHVSFHNFLKVLPAELQVTDAASETNRCFFVHLGVALSIHPFALQAAFRHFAANLSTTLEDWQRDIIATLQVPSSLIDANALCFLWPQEFNRHRICVVSGPSEAPIFSFFLPAEPAVAEEELVDVLLRCERDHFTLLRPYSSREHAPKRRFRVLSELKREAKKAGLLVMINKVHASQGKSIAQAMERAALT